VTPVLNASDPFDFTNYRPISIIKNVAKLFVYLVSSNIKRSLNYIIIDERHVFRPGKSTVTCNVAFTTYLLDSIKKGDQVDVVFIDFKKHLTLLTMASFILINMTQIC